MGPNWLVYAIIAGVVVLFLFLLIVGGVIFFVMKKRKARQAAEQSEKIQAVEESSSHDLPPSSATNWEDAPDTMPVWQEPSAKAEPQVNTGSYSGESYSSQSSPSPYYESQTPEPSSPFASPQAGESTQQPTGPMQPAMNTTPPSPSPKYPTSPNLSMNTATNMPADLPHENPPQSNLPADAPMLDETGVTMDLSSYKKIIEDQLKPKSPGSIVFTSGALEGKTYEVPAEGFFIGRDSHASQVVIPDPRVSKSHLWVGWKDGKVTVVDQESRNGTFINDTASPKVTESEIKDGDVVILGEANVARFEFKAVTN